MHDLLLSRLVFSWFLDSRGYYGIGKENFEIGKEKPTYD